MNATNPIDPTTGEPDAPLQTVDIDLQPIAYLQFGWVKCGDNPLELALAIEASSGAPMVIDHLTGSAVIASNWDQLCKAIPRITKEGIGHVAH